MSVCLQLKDGVDASLLLSYKMEDDGTRVISLLRGCPQGVVVRGLRVIMWKYWFFNLHRLEEIALCVISNYSVVFLCVCLLYLLLLAGTLQHGISLTLCVLLCFVLPFSLTFWD